MPDAASIRTDHFRDLLLQRTPSVPFLTLRSGKQGEEVLRRITNTVRFVKRNLHPLFWLGVLRGVCVWHPVLCRRSASKAGRQEGGFESLPLLPAFLPSCEPKPNHPPLDGIHFISCEGREGKRSPSLRPPFPLRSLREPAPLWKASRPHLGPRSSPGIALIARFWVDADEPKSLIFMVFQKFHGKPENVNSRIL